MKDTIHVALGFDNNFIMPCGVTILSACMNTDANIVFHAIIADDVSEDNKDKLVNLVGKYGNKILFYTINESVFDGLPENVHIRKATYNRLLLPELIPSEINKVLYLDCDIIVCNSLVSLWNIDLGNYPLAATVDAKGSGVIEHNAIDLPMNEIYYNAGVLLMDLKLWRKEEIGKKCLDYIARTNCPWMDQDAINSVLRSRIKYFDVKYNLQTLFFANNEKDWGVEKSRFFDEVRKALNAPVILHYSAPSKPWMIGCGHSEEWLRYKLMSPWKDEMLKPNFFNNYYVWKLKEAFDIDNGTLKDNAPVYFLLFIKTVNKYPIIFKMVNKMLWFLVKIL